MQPPPDVERLFVAVLLPEDVRAALDAHLRAALGGRPLPGRPVPAGNWHLTLRFLGDTPPAQAAALRAELHGAARGAPFALGLGGYGAFPRPTRAAVLWLGATEGVEELGRLAGIAEAAARAAGFPPEGRPFRPHLTLGRFQPPRDIADLLATLPPFAARFTVEELVLLRSRLGHGAARYEAVDRFRLPR